MANYDSFVFEGHGTSEKTGAYDPGATYNGVKENDLADAIVNSAMEYLKRSGLNIHRDENNFVDHDLAGNTYKFKCGTVVHINAGKGSGVEVYVPINEKYISTDVQFCKDVSSLLGIPNRGVKSRDYNSGRTYNRTHGTAIGGTDYYGEIRDAWNRGISLSIIEVGFIDSSDVTKIQANIKGIGRLVAKYICTCCDAKLVEDTTPSKPNQPAATNGVYQVICGSFANKNNALKMQDDLKKAGFNTFLEFEKR